MNEFLAKKEKYKENKRKKRKIRRERKKNFLFPVSTLLLKAIAHFLKKDFQGGEQENIIDPKEYR